MASPKFTTTTMRDSTGREHLVTILDRTMFDQGAQAIAGNGPMAKARVNGASVADATGNVAAYLAAHHFDKLCGQWVASVTEPVRVIAGGEPDGTTSAFRGFRIPRPAL